MPIVSGDVTINGKIALGALVDMYTDMHFTTGSLDAILSHVNMQASEGFAISVVQDLGQGDTLGGKFVVSMVGTISFTIDPNNSSIPIPDLVITYEVKGYNDANQLVYSDEATLNIPFTDPSSTD